MNSPDADKRAIGLAFRRAEQRGIHAPPDELRQRVVRSPLAATAIDEGLDLLVAVDGRTIGGSLELNAISAEWQERLVETGIAKRSRGLLTLTRKGQELSALLDEYASNRHRWRSLIFEANDRKEAPA